MYVLLKKYYDGDYRIVTEKHPIKGDVALKFETEAGAKKRAKALTQENPTGHGYLIARVLVGWEPRTALTEIYG